MRGGQTRSHVSSLTNSSQNSSCLVFILLSWAGSQGQQSKQSHLLQPSEEDLPQGLLAVAQAWNRPGGVQRPSKAGFSSLTGLLTLSVRKRPASLRRKLLPAACIHDRGLSAPPQSSSPGAQSSNCNSLDRLGGLTE